MLDGDFADAEGHEILALGDHARGVHRGLVVFQRDGNSASGW